MPPAAVRAMCREHFKTKLMQTTILSRSVQPPPCPPAGSGVHTWLLSAANTLHRQGEAETATADYLRTETATCGRPVHQREIEDAVRKAFQSNWTPSKTLNSGPTFKSHARLKFNPQRLKEFAAKGPKVDAAWLERRSPVSPWNNGPSTLKWLFEPGDVIHIFDDMKSSTPKYSPCVNEYLDSWMSPTLTHHAPDGVWFLCNPTGGRSYMNPRTGKVSLRSQESIIRFPYAVLESDTAPADQWLSALVQIPIRISAIYTSGGRSIHALWKVATGSKEEWDAAVEPFKRPLKVLGADAGALSAVRLSRLPGCIRNKTGRMQTLLYLDPAATGTPLAEMPSPSWIKIIGVKKEGRA